jgi:hypothetical protein
MDAEYVVVRGCVKNGKNQRENTSFSFSCIFDYWMVAFVFFCYWRDQRWQYIAAVPGGLESVRVIYFFLLFRDFFDNLSTVLMLGCGSRAHREMQRSLHQMERKWRDSILDIIFTSFPLSFTSLDWKVSNRLHTECFNSSISSVQ